MSVLAVIVVPDAAMAARPLAGRPLLAHTIEQTASARHVGRTIVVTGDATLIRIATDLGAQTTALPRAAEGGADVASAVRQALAALEPDTGFLPALALVLTPGFPLRSAAMIDSVVEHMARVGADSLLTVHPLTDPLWLRDEGGLAQPADPRPTRRRFVQNGAVDAVRIAAFEREGTIPAGRIVLFEVAPMSALRLREEDDWQAADTLVQRRRARDVGVRLRSIRLLALDFDGVVTDNRVLVFEDGREAVLCNRSDGLGLERLRAAGLPVVVISKERNPVVSARCRKLSIPCEQGIEDKLDVLKRICGERGLSLGEVAFFGNDVNDLACLSASGLALAPADAHADVIRQAHYVTVAPGGIGAVREICDLWLAAQVEA
jgi:YrbI family 3-deoxy-D-manno-octulosonate 8-phosphate phosphatase